MEPSAAQNRRAVLVTGAGGALGGHVCEAFAHAGWRLGLAAYDEREHAELTRTHPEAVVRTVALHEAEAARSGLTGLVDDLGGVDGLIHLVGGFAMSPATESDGDELERMLTLNLRTAVHAVRAVLPHLLARGDGFVIGIGAAPGLEGGPGMASYAAGKGALIAWLRSLRRELAPRSVRVSIVHPLGAFDTPQNRRSMPDTDPRTFIDPAEIAATILHVADRGARGALDELRVLPPA
ncbi:MAG: SDR family NAD(P)-dependent oxidoreductase [Gemmatimonadota bacterium]